MAASTSQIQRHQMNNQDASIDRCREIRILLQQALQKLDRAEAKAQASEYMTNDEAYNYAYIMGNTNGVLNAMDKVIF